MIFAEEVSTKEHNELSEVIILGFLVFRTSPKMSKDIIFHHILSSTYSNLLVEADSEGFFKVHFTGDYFPTFLCIGNH